MRILGISGFEASVPFKRARWPHLDEREYRIAQGHDSAAALIVDGTIVAAVAEERISRRKHSGDFPAGAIAYCLAESGLVMQDIDELVHSFDYRPYRSAYVFDPVSRDRYERVYSRDALLGQVARHLPSYPPERVRHVSHHLAHAASAYYTSGWDDCLVVVIDGMGEAHSLTAYRARGSSLDSVADVSAEDSIGILYSLVTLHLGFDFNADEYKVMGLAPYGDPERFQHVFEGAVKLLPDGKLRIAPLHLNRTWEERERYLATRAYLTKHLIPPRAPNDEITQAHRDVAAALQACLDNTMLHLCGHFARRTQQRLLALAGGVALNCVSNGKLLRSGMFDEIYVQPAAGDDGSALGAALLRAASVGDVRNQRLPIPFLGPRPAPAEVDAALRSFADRVEVVRFETFTETCGKAAALIADGRVIGWYRGRMEFGPRALGHRSILADPSRPQMRDRINAMVKMREAFRPFAPAVSIEQVDRWFEVSPKTKLPFMIMTVDVRPEFRKELVAVTHVDGSARVQTVSPDDNQEFHELLQAVGDATGREIVLNTSFNIKGQPIVNTPREAIETFLDTGIEYLFLEDNFVSRSQP